MKSVEFEIDREYVGRVVGSQGSHLNKLRESLGVKIDLPNEGDNFKDTGKKRKGTAQKSKITVCKSPPILGNTANILI
jgi:predicted PilT family ATPase